MPTFGYVVDVNLTKGTLVIVRKRTQNGTTESYGEIDTEYICDILDKLPINYFAKYFRERSSQRFASDFPTCGADITDVRESIANIAEEKIRDNSIERLVGRTCYFIDGSGVRRGKVAEASIAFAAPILVVGNGKNYIGKHEVRMAFKIEVKKSDSSSTFANCDKIYFSSEDAFNALEDKAEHE